MDPTIIMPKRGLVAAWNEIANLTRHDTNLLQVRRCRGCLVWHNNDKDGGIPFMGVQSFRGHGILVITDQRILAYLGSVRLFHSKWENINDLEASTDYSKDLAPLLCLSIPSIFPGDIEYRFETDRAHSIQRRIHYLLHWYLALECAPGTPRRYASEIWC